MTKQFIALGVPRAHARWDLLQPLLVPEVEAVWSAYRAGLIRQIFERADRPGVVMICEAEGRAAVEEMLAALPMSVAGFLDTEVIELKPFEMWSAIFARPPGDGSGTGAR